MKIVIDTNIFIAAIIKPSSIRQLLVEAPIQLLFPEVILSEINEHKTLILKKSGLNPNEFETVKTTLLRYVEIIPKKTIKPFYKQALEIIGSIDPDDAPFIATCLANDAILWSDDKNLKKQKAIKVLNTKEIIKLFTNHDEI